MLYNITSCGHSVAPYISGHESRPVISEKYRQGWLIGGLYNYGGLYQPQVCRKICCGRIINYSICMINR